MSEAIFDAWTDQYDAWFSTPIGRLIQQVESEILLDLLAPQSGEHILDAGCGTGIFTRDVLMRGCRITGIDLSEKMLAGAQRKLADQPFEPLAGDITRLPFTPGTFDRTFSMTAVEFVADIEKAIHELNRVTRKGGTIVLSTLNSKSPWADRRRKKAEQGHPLFEQIYFRSPEDLQPYVPKHAVFRTAVHFQKHDPIEDAIFIEESSKEKGLDTGAFLAVQWVKT